VKFDLCYFYENFVEIHQIWLKSDKNLGTPHEDPSTFVLLRAVRNIMWFEINVKVKVKFSLEQAMKAQRGSTGIDILFL
jgi:hypothetical protein